jgi:hypothetical protein
MCSSLIYKCSDFSVTKIDLLGKYFGLLIQKQSFRSLPSWDITYDVAFEILVNFHA